jgi:hypothetical protein
MAKIILEQATKVQMGSIGIALPFLKPRAPWCWVANATPQPL